MIATIGFFDGVHLGHRHLIDTMISEGRQMGQETMVITFNCHPRQVVQPEWRPQLLTSLDEKLSLLKATGVNRCHVLHFDREMASLSAHDFMRDVLKGQLGVTTLITGYDNRFGHDRLEGFDDYVRYGKEMGLNVMRGDELTVGDVNVSSSSIRRMLAEGHLVEATRCLDRYYTITGKVVEGEQIGRTIGFPTANISPNDCLKLIPANGVYAAEAYIDSEGECIGDDSVSNKKFKAMVNIGHRPTFDGKKDTIEAHLLNFSGNLYGHTLTIAFKERIREERRFRSPEELITQIREDEAKVLNG